MLDREMFPEAAGRAFDIFASAVGLLLTMPFILAACAFIAVEDGFPVFFVQTRVGRGGIPFRLVKIRSMRAAKAGPMITTSADARVTRSGRFLRRYKIDELPQLWNVLRGDMSIIGPRPEVPKYVDMRTPAWRAVLASRPGITDLATLLLRNEECELAAADDPEKHYRENILPSKLRLSARYLQTRTIRLDLKLLVYTICYSFRPRAFDAEAVRRRFPCGDLR